MRTRSAAILIQNNSLALIERHRDGMHYFAFPGGGVDEGESPEQAVVREAREELGVEIRVLRLAAKIWFRGNPQFFFLAEQVGGEFGTGTGEEYASDRMSRFGCRLQMSPQTMFCLRRLLRWWCGHIPKHGLPTPLLSWMNNSLCKADH
jgi:8-oxo-dGTP diphosphatase